MSYHKELLTEIVDKWTLEQIEEYILQLLTRREELDTWIRHVRVIIRKKKSKTTPENGPRDGR